MGRSMLRPYKDNLARAFDSLHCLRLTTLCVRALNA